MGSETAAPGGARREDAPFGADAPSSSSPGRGGALGVERRTQAGLASLPRATHLCYICGRQASHSTRPGSGSIPTQTTDMPEITSPA